MSTASLEVKACAECGRWNYHLQGCTRHELELALRDVERLADVCRGFLDRHGRMPNATSRDLLDAIDRALGRSS